MTNHECAEQFDVVFDGTQPLLPEYGGASSLATLATRPAKASSYVPVVQKRQAGGVPSRYSPAQRAAMRHLRAQGIKLRTIADRYHVPLSSVYTIVRSQNGR